jgi:integration host factor subunit beta
MTKADLIAVIADKLKLPWMRAETIVDQVFACMTHALQRGEGIEIRGFGSFTVRNYKAYEGRNPRTGDVVEVKPKRMAFFRVGRELRERVNQGRVGEASNANPAIRDVPVNATGGERVG